MLYKKCLTMKKNISKDICKDIVGTYKRAANILDQELKNKTEDIQGQPESFLFKKDEEKHLYSKINDIRKSVVSMSVGQPQAANKIVKDWIVEEAPPEPEPEPSNDESDDGDDDKKKKKKKK